MSAAKAMRMNPFASSPVSRPRRRASRSMTTNARARPIAYMIPYQWTASGPTENAIGCGVQSITAAVYRRVADPSAASASSAPRPYTRGDARPCRRPVNTEYVLWFAVLVVVTGAVLLWLAIGDVPEVPADPGAASEPGTASEPAGEDGLARPT